MTSSISTQMRCTEISFEKQWSENSFDYVGAEKAVGWIDSFEGIPSPPLSRTLQRSSVFSEVYRTWNALKSSHY